MSARRAGRFAGALALSAVVGGSGALSAQEAAGYTVLRETADRIVAVLPNRLLVVAQELHTTPVVSAQVWVKTGSIYEQEHVGAGLSHLLEHLVSGGTTATRTEDDTNRELGRIGARTNAGTTLDSVSYYIDTTAEHASEAIDLLSDWLQHSTIPQAEFEREKSVVLREFEMGEGEPARILWKLTQQARYLVHPARHPTIGYRDVFEGIQRDEVEAFYRRMYVPNNMVFVVAGDIDRQAVVRQVAAAWADSPARPLPELSFPREPEQQEPRYASGRAAVQRPRLRIAWPATRAAAPGDYELDLLSVILGQGESSRMARLARDRDESVTQVVAYNSSFAWGEGFFALDAEVAVPQGADADQVAEALDTARRSLLGTVEETLVEGVTDDELALAKRQVMARVAQDGQSANRLAGRLASGLIDHGDPDYLKAWAERVQNITREEVVAAGRRYLVPRHYIEVVLEPLQGDQAEIAKSATATSPSPPPQTAEVTERDPVDLDNSRLVGALRRLPAVDRTAAAVETSPVRTFVLDNGLRLLVERSTLVPTVAVEVFQIGGLLGEQPGRQGVANAAEELRMRGTEERTADELAREIERLGAEISTSCGNNSTSTQAVGLAEDLDAILDLVADVTLRPSFPEAEWKTLQPRLLAALDRRTDHWTSELSLVFRGAYFADTPWATNAQGLREVVEGLEAPEIAKYYYEHLAADQTVVAVFGDIEIEDAQKAVAKAFAEMPSHAAKPFALPEWEPPRAQIVDRSSNKPLSAAEIGLGPLPERGHPDAAPLQVLGEVLGAFPYGRLPQELRGRGPGLVYAVSAYPVFGLAPGYFSVLFNAEGDRLLEALDRSVAALAAVRDQTLAAEELERARASVATSELIFKQSNEDRALEAALNVLYGVGLDYTKRFLDEVRRVEPDDLQRVAQKYLRNPVAVVLSPEPPAREAIEKILARLPSDS